MKLIFVFISIFSLSIWAQNPTYSYLGTTNDTSFSCFVEEAPLGDGAFHLQVLFSKNMGGRAQVNLTLSNQNLEKTHTPSRDSYTVFDYHLCIPEYMLRRCYKVALYRGTKGELLAVRIEENTLNLSHLEQVFYHQAKSTCNNLLPL